MRYIYIRFCLTVASYVVIVRMILFVNSRSKFYVTPARLPQCAIWSKRLTQGIQRKLSNKALEILSPVSPGGKVDIISARNMQRTIQGETKETTTSRPTLYSSIIRVRPPS